MSLQQENQYLKEQLKDVKEQLQQKSQSLQSVRKTNKTLMDHNEFIKKKFATSQLIQSNNFNEKLKEMQAKIMDLITQNTHLRQNIDKNDYHKSKQVQILSELSQNRTRMEDRSSEMLRSNEIFNRQVTSLKLQVDKLRAQNKTFLQQRLSLMETIKMLQAELQRNQRNYHAPELISEKDLSLSLIDIKNPPLPTNQSLDSDSQNNEWVLRPSEIHEKMFTSINSYFKQINAAQKRKFASLMSAYFDNKLDEILDIDQEFD